MDVEPPSDIIVRRQAPSARNVEFARYPPGFDATRRHAAAEAARNRRSNIHNERRDARMTRGEIVPYGPQPMEDIDENYYHTEL